MIPAIPRMLSATDFCLLYWITRKKLKALIRAGRIRTVEGLRPMRIYDPEWVAAVGLRPASTEHIPLLRCAEVAELLNLSPREIRYMAFWG